MKAPLLACVLMLGFGSYCKAQCLVDIPADTVTSYWGYEPLHCVTLDPIASGTAPFQYQWSNGATTSAILVCDTTSSWYHVTLTDDSLCTSSDSVYVQVIDVRCGNNMKKVAVCHIPPGNPANAHTICISKNGVPAHLAHGCYLGPCSPPMGPMPPVPQPVPGMIQISVSPNPVSDVAVVSVTSLAAQHITLSVIDATGRRLSVLLDADMIAQEQRTVQLNNTQLPKGTSMFWLEAKSDSDLMMQRVVLIR